MHEPIKYVRYAPKIPPPCAPCAPKESAGPQKPKAPACDSAGLYGLLHYRKWWEQNEVDLSVCGTLISGTPIFIEENTLRVINSKYSYFIPLEKIDYIRTTDGLCTSFQRQG